LAFLRTTADLTRDREVESTGGNRTPKLIIAAAAQTGSCRLVPHNMYRDDDPLFFWGQFCDVAKSGDEPEEDLARSGYKLNTNVIL